MEQLALYADRRQKLIEQVKTTFNMQEGVIALPAAFENEHHRFRQDSSFYYFTGLNEPALVLLLHLDGRQELYVPNFGNERHKWVNVVVDIDTTPARAGVTAIKHLSKEKMGGYSYAPYAHKQTYSQLLADVQAHVESGQRVFSIIDAANFELFHLLSFMMHHVGSSLDAVGNIADIAYHMRRIKDDHEIALMNKAIDITVQAQRSTAQAIKHGVPEWHVQAIIEQEFRSNQSPHNSFPTIVATGKNSTILHYVDNNCIIQQGDLVVVDIGAEYGHYAADLTRTYPASGVFTDRQKEIYQLVLDAQEYAAQQAKPGMFLRNIPVKEQSLHWLVAQFFAERGYGDYFPHGLGHFQGLDVHDVGDYTKPLEVGDIFTIEPGLYIREESLGVRIEDNYGMRGDGAQCLSSQLGKTVADVELLMQAD